MLGYINLNDSKKNWKKISKVLKTKSPQQCVYRFKKLITKSLNVKWIRSEDIKLIELIENFGYDWDLFTKLLNKPKDAIINRYKTKLDPKLKRSKFSDEEDNMIIKLYKKYGNKWNQICKFLPNRNSEMIKNRYYSYIRKNLKNNHSKVTSSEYIEIKPNISIVPKNITTDKNLNDYDVKLPLNNYPNMNEIVNNNNFSINDCYNLELMNNIYFQNLGNKLILQNPSPNLFLDDLHYNNYNNSYQNINQNLNDDKILLNTLKEINNNSTNLFKNNCLFENKSNEIFDIPSNYFDKINKNTYNLGNYHNEDFLEDFIDINKNKINLNNNILSTEFNVDMFFDNELENQRKSILNFNKFINDYDVNIHIKNPILLNKEERNFLLNDNNMKMENNPQFEMDSMTVKEFINLSQNYLDNCYINGIEELFIKKNNIENAYKNIIKLYVDKIKEIQLPRGI